MFKTGRVAHHEDVYAGVFACVLGGQKRMRALDVNIIGHGGMSVGAREREIAISNVRARRGGQGGLSRGITSLATRRLYFQQGGIDRH